MGPVDYSSLGGGGGGGVAKKIAKATHALPKQPQS